MTKEEINYKVKYLIADVSKYDEGAIFDDDCLLDDLGMDSLDVVEFIMKIESEFLISIPDSDFENIIDIDVNKVVNNIYNKLNK